MECGGIRILKIRYYCKTIKRHCGVATLGCLSSKKDVVRSLFHYVRVRTGSGNPGKSLKIFEALEIPGNPGKALKFFL